MSALSGIRVIDFGQYIAGPLTAMLLADNGADVVRVDPPGGPRWRTPANAYWNRGKRSVVLDLAGERDRVVAKRLIEGADVVIENFRAGVMDRLGLGPAEMTAANPRLVYCSLPGFAHDDPRATVAAWEGVVGAATATYRPSPLSGSGRPTYTAVPIASAYGAFQSAVSVVMALLARERDGCGQRIEVPLFDAMFASIGTRGLRVHNPTQLPFALRPLWSGPFRCKDDRWVYFMGAGNQNFRQFVEEAGLRSWDEEGLTDLERLRDDPDLSAEVQRRVHELFRTRTAQEWEDLVARAGSECAVCRTSAEWLDHPHARASNMVVEVEDPELGKTLQPGINARLGRTPGEIRWPAPLPDQHRDAILAELDRRHQAPADVSPRPSLAAALEGVRVLDLSIVLAGPTLGRTLAEFGADVIKIDSPRRPRVAFHTDINRGKRSILLDLKSEDGREVFWRLLEDTDVVCENYRAGKLERLGLGYDEVRKRKPDVVYASLNAYGYEGPWRPRPGHEQLAQATTGMQSRFGGEGPPALQPNPVNDYGTGFLGAYAVALALYHRRRTGEGQRVDTALAYTAMTLQSPFVMGHEGQLWDEPSGQDTLGSGPLHRAYEARDGWLFLGATGRDLPALSAIVGRDLSGLAGPALAVALEGRLQSDDVESWVERLTSAGIGAHRVVSDVAELMSDPWVVAHGLSLTREHDGLGLVTTTGPTPRLSGTPVRPGRPASKPGADGREVLEEIGWGDRFESLVAKGVIRLEGMVAG